MGRDNYFPEVSSLDQELIDVDSDTKEMLKLLNLQITQSIVRISFKRPHGAI